MQQDTPDLEWLDGDVPRARQFADTYFSKAGGLAETRHVFLRGNRLPGRWVGLDTFTIGEFGFGTGLNFLATLEALSAMDPAPHVTFLSFELHPLSRNQLERALAAFPELASLTGPLLDRWRPAPGWQILSFDGADLVLGIGDARQMIAQVEPHAAAGRARVEAVAGKVVVAPVDAWFLDGFSPARNPELWQEDLLKSAAGLTAPGGTLATYTSAGWVRRNLIAAGFSIAKAKGFAGKREMVEGVLPGPADTSLIPGR
ncbi:FAD-dependent oxidoreductase [Roseibium aquae]|uniref:FAD-dependent oxidoreductase n=1 Tax=Roseibium aquae TaxID=1323746 RepID=A0A916TJW5_9HYPH|nr:tRNA (5-methylaminomethyl-2-thiouridine)(34)-methyltransferase MnmD [Roseibium aquae]GGB50022.1 FAD-dependent oxidoreductase [Roseibium aquae]